MPADMSNSNNNNAAACPNPLRHCHIGRSADFSGYGFNLHTIKGKVGQFIGQVDDGSPAEVALLRRGDRIIEVNGVNIAAENHKQVVSRIKLVEDETTLLVVDEEGDAWYKDHKMVLSAALPGVVKGTSVVNRSRRESSSSSEGRKSLTEDGKAEDRRSLSSATSSAASSDASNRQAFLEQRNNVRQQRQARLEHQEDFVVNEQNHHSYELAGRDHDHDHANHESAEHAKHSFDLDHVFDELDHGQEFGSYSLDHSSEQLARKRSPMSTSPTPPSSVGAPSPTPTRTIEENNKNTTKTKTIYPTTDGLNMNMSVSEMRALLASRKKKDIRHSEMDLKKKYEIVQKL